MTSDEEREMKWSRRTEAFFVVLAWAAYVNAVVQRWTLHEAGNTRATYSMAMGCFFLLLAIRQRQKRQSVTINIAPTPPP